MKKLIIGILLVTLFIVLIVKFRLKDSSAPTFVDRTAPPSLVEILAEPASFTYGSSIDVWFFRDSSGNQIKEIAVTGHADSRTCGLMSSLFFNTFLQKYENPQDFFVAGAGRLVNRFDNSLIESLESQEIVKLYLNRHEEKKRIEFMLELFAGFSTISETEESPLEDYESQLEEITAELDDLENDPSVKEYKLILYTEESFSKFAEESNRHAANSGLVRVHQVPVEIITAVEKRLKSQIESDTASIINFSDILADHDLDEAVVWTETYRLDNGEPLVIRLPLGELSKKSFEKAKEENRNEVEIAMVGDAKRRIEFFNDQIIKVNKQLTYYAQLQPWQLQETIYLNQCISSEGVVYDCDGEYVTAQEYYQERIPGLIKFLKGNIVDLELMMAEIEKDKSREQDGKVEAINHMTLIDAMLRDWNLPVGSSQRAFDKWREDQRSNTWKRIGNELKQNKISVSALESENIVFAIRTYDDILEIKPMQILDLTNSVVVLNKDLGIAKVESAWSHRKKIKINERVAEVSDKVVSPVILDRIATITEEDHFEDSEELIIELLNIYPKQTLVGLEHLFSKVSDANEQYKAELLKEVKPSILTKEVISTIERFNSDPQYEDDLIAYIRDFRNLLLSYPDAPVDLHLSFAIRLAEFLAEIQNMQNMYLSSSESISPWEVLEKCEESPDAYENESRVIMEKLEIPFSLADEVRNIISLIKSREEKYYETAKLNQAFPDEGSNEFKKLSEQTEEITLFEREAQNYLTTLYKLKNLSLGENAALGLVIEDRPKLQPVIEELINATNGNFTSKNLFFLNALDRLKHHLENDINLDNISRVQIYHTIQTGCENTLKELEYFDHGDKVISGYNQLYSRFLYESGEFGLAIDNLFDSLTSVISYHPDLSWRVLEDDWVGSPYPRKVEATVTGNSILIKAWQENSVKNVLEITGLPSREAKLLSDKINILPKGLWQYDGKVSGKILMAKVQIRKELRNLFEVISSSKVKLAMLKAMVYASIPPGVSLVEPGGEDKIGNDSKSKRRNDKLLIGEIKEIQIPSLEELERMVKPNFESQMR